MATGAPDPLFNLRNNFYIGAYQAVINSDDVHNLSEEDSVERDCLIYRSYIKQGNYQIVVNEVNSSAVPPLQAVKLLALYYLSPDNKETVISSIREWLSDAAIRKYPILRHIAGIIFMDEQDYNKALNYTFGGGTMELMALNVEIFFKMGRSDAAENELRVMQLVDKDHTLTQLATALLYGHSRIPEAYLIYQDLIEKYKMTDLLLNGKAECCMRMGNFEDAESVLLEALNKDAKDPEALANMVICSAHLGKPTSRFASQLKLYHPGHRRTKQLVASEEEFARAVSYYS